MKPTLLMVLVGLPGWAGAPANMDDLQAMATTGAWSELLERAEDVPAAKRSPLWKELVASAATAVVQADETRASALASRYPFLSANTAFAKAQGQAALTAFEKCLRVEREGRDVLLDCEGGLRKAAPNATPELLVQAAKVLRRQFNPAASVELYAQAASRSKDVCTDAGLQESTLAALELPADAPRAKTGRTLAFETCWPALSPALKSAMVHASSYLRANACGPLRAKKALTELQDELCREDGQ
ncbi:MAG: hypothetical protein JNJ54_27865 [Myxococcaceae bacterium]|nr:hypothetical protein [Myxococcaceae bacterium]